MAGQYLDIALESIGKKYQNEKTKIIGHGIAKRTLGCALERLALPPSCYPPPLRPPLSTEDQSRRGSLEDDTRSMGPHERSWQQAVPRRRLAILQLVPQQLVPRAAVERQRH